MALRVLADLARFAEKAAPPGATVVLTMTAPIRLPAKTVAVVERDIAALIAEGGGERRTMVHGNAVALRLVGGVGEVRRRPVGFIHNPDVAASQLLDLAERWLHGVNG